MTLNRTEVARIEVKNDNITGEGVPVVVISGGGGGIGGDASAAKQDVGNASLASIDGKLPALAGGRIPVSLPAGGGGLTDAELRATPVPVSVSGGGGLTDTELRATPVPVSGTVTITDGSGPVTVDGTVAVSGSVAVTGPLTDAQLRAVAVPVSAAALPLPAGAATAAKQDVEHADLASLLTELQQKTEPADQQHVIIDSSATVPVSGPLTDAQLRASAVPISGTVTITDGSGPVTVDGSVSVSSSALPAGAATDAGLATLLAELQQKLEPADIAALATSAKQDTGNTSLASLVTALALLTLAQASDGVAATGPMVQALADDAPPQRITGMVYPLSLTADGRLRVAATNSNADHDFWGGMTPSFFDRQADPWHSLPAHYF